MSQRSRRKAWERKRSTITNNKRKKRHSKILKLENYRRSERGRKAKKREGEKAVQRRAEIVADARKIPKKKRHKRVVNE